MAKDLDYNPFRAISAFNEADREICQSGKNCTLLDMEQIFSEGSRHGIAGFELFLEQGMIDKAALVLQYAPEDGKMVGVGLARDVLSVLPRYVDLERREIPGLSVDPEEQKQIDQQYQQFYEREYLDPNRQPERDTS